MTFSYVKGAVGVGSDMGTGALGGLQREALMLPLRR